MSLVDFMGFHGEYNSTWIIGVVGTSSRETRFFLPRKNKVTRLLSTRVKSIKMDVLTCDLQCFVGILIQGGEVQKDAKLCFSSTAASRSSRSCCVGRRTGICIPTDRGK